MKFRISLQIKILVPVLLSTILLLGIAGIFLYQTSRVLIQDLVNSDLQNLASGQASEVKAQFNTMFGTVSALTSAFSSFEELTPRDRRKVFDILMSRTLKDNPSLYAVWTTWEINALDGNDQSNKDLPGSNEIGRFVSTWYREKDSQTHAGVPETELETADYYLLVKEGKKPIIMEPYFYSYTGGTDDEVFETSYVEPIFNKNGDYVAEVGVDLVLSLFQNLLKEVKPYGQGYAVLLSNSGMAIYHPDTELIGKDYLMNHPGSKEKIVQGESFRYTAGSTLNPTQEFFIPIQIGQTATPWYLGLVIPQNLVDSKVQDLFNLFLLSGIILVGILIILLTIITRVMTQPVNKLSRQFQDLVTGQGDLTKKVILKSRDELGVLADHFNNFLEFLHEIILQIKDTTHANTKTSDSLSLASQNSVSALEEIKRNLSSSHINSIKLDDELLRSGNRLTEVDNFLQDLRERLSSQAQSLTRAGESLNQITQSVISTAEEIRRRAQDFKSLKNAASDGEREMEQTIEQISKVSQAAEVIRDLLRIIDNISSQTNLLAMNAAIEAAHAGNSGRGFAVVAGEIRKLAEETAKNSKNIGTSLSEALELISEAKQSSAKTGSSFQLIKIGIDDASQGLDLIGGRMEGLRNETQDIDLLLQGVRTTSHQVTKAGEEAVTQVGSVSGGLKLLGGLSGETRGGMEEINLGVDEIHLQLRKISDQSQHNAEQVNFVSNLAARFQTKKGHK